MTGKDEMITIEDGLTVSEIAKLLEVTNLMARAINKKEFMEILAIYNKATERLLEED